jgi:hypothetical protein
MALQPLFQWCENTAIGSSIRGSIWLFPAIEAIHLLALALIGGVVLIVDLRLLGVGLRRHSLARLSTSVQPWLVGSLAAMVLTGALLFTSEAIKCYFNLAFWLKMLFLSLAVAFTFTIRRRVAGADGGFSSRVNRLVGLVSLTLWSGVGLMGRGIGFY